MEMLKGTDNQKMKQEYRKKEIDISKTDAQELPDNYLLKIENDLKFCGYI